MTWIGRDFLLSKIIIEKKSGIQKWVVENSAIFEATYLTPNFESVVDNLLENPSYTGILKHISDLPDYIVF